MRTVITKVASATPLSPKDRVKTAVAKDVARILTKLLPNKTEPIRRSLSSVILRARFAPREPLSACARNFPRDAAVKAVSLPEKKSRNNYQAHDGADRDPERGIHIGFRCALIR